MAAPNASPYQPISTVLAELESEGLNTPHIATVRRWVGRRVRAQRVGANRLLVNRDDVRRLCTPTLIVGGV